MENAIQSFTNTEFGELEILQEGDKFWFPASKCATLLGYTNPRKAIIDHCRGDGVTNRYGVSQTTNQHGVTTNQVNEMKYITESHECREIFSDHSVNRCILSYHPLHPWNFRRGLISV